MPETIEKVALSAIATPAEPTATQETKPAILRDEFGRFLSPGETADGDPGAPPPDGQAEESAKVDSTEAAPASEPPKESPETVPVEAPVGLTLDDDRPAIFDHQGKFVGGKFLDKYESLDDLTAAHKSLVKELGHLQYELSQARDGSGEKQAADPLPMADPESITPEQLEELVDQALGVDAEMSFDDRVAYEENPARYLARENAKRESVRQGIRGKADDVVARTRTAYVKVWDSAYPHGQRVWADIKRGNVSSVEARVLLGLGLMAREGMLSGETTVTKQVRRGSAPEKMAAVAVPVKPAPGKSEEDFEFELGRKAAYGA